MPEQNQAAASRESYGGPGEGWSSLGQQEGPPGARGGSRAREGTGQELWWCPQGLVLSVVGDTGHFLSKTLSATLVAAPQSQGRPHHFTI